MYTTQIDHAGLSNKAATSYSATEAKNDSNLDLSIQKIKKLSAATILPVHVSLCLASHIECTGIYSDERGHFLLRCACSCHQDYQDDVMKK
jgi:hypothetical protein